MFTYVLAPAPLSTTKEVIVAVCQAVAQPFPQPHFPAHKIWDEPLVAAATKVTGDGTFNEKRGRFERPLLIQLERQIPFRFD